MISVLANHHQKKAACILLSIFYVNFITASYAQIVSESDMTAQRESVLVSTAYTAPRTVLPSKPTEHTKGKVFGKDMQPPAGVQVQNDELPYNKDAVYSSGPSQPEMQSFQTVNDNNMVDLFTGDFSYNIPLMDVGGYPINIFYHSGITMDQDASWVGLGWNLNPGSITRSMRGLPDDFNGANDTILKVSSIKDNQTIGMKVGADFELLGFPKDANGNKIDTAAFQIGNFKIDAGVFHNTYRGWGMEMGLHPSLNAGAGGKGCLTTGLSIQNSTQEGLTISPSLSVSMAKKISDDNMAATGSLSTSLAYNSRSGLGSLQVTGNIGSSGKKKYRNGETHESHGYGMTVLSAGMSFAYPSYTPTISMPYTNSQISFTIKLGAAFLGIHGPNFYLTGYQSNNRIALDDQVQSHPAYGYLNFQNAAKDISALMDYNREKEIPYREKPAVPNIGVPSYTYDVFQISGEGTGGSFRAYRSDIGYVYDHLMSTKSETGQASIDLGGGNVFHGGVDIYVNYASTTSGPWVTDNSLKNSIAFKNSDATFEAAYFRNPGEKTINSKVFYDAIGGDDVVTPKLEQFSNSSSSIIATNYLKRYKNKQYIGDKLLTPQNAIKGSRDKRSQIISYLTAEEATRIGLAKEIISVPLNQWSYSCPSSGGGEGGGGDEGGDNPPPGNSNSNDDTKRVNSYRHANHLSEITVLNNDGRRYVYGLPVYNLKEIDVTSSVSATKGSIAEGLVKYNDGADNAQQHPDISEGRDNYYTKEVIPSYAHSFLLTSILSADYMDVTGNGISTDDFGDAITFNYSKVAGNDNPFKWRAPYIKDSVTYNEGLRTDKRDDKASFQYGEKELWYLNSVESKNMVAVFTVEDRKDMLPIDENGVKDYTNNNHNGSKLLRKIALYTKAELIKNGTKAKAIKTVHFEYSYELCRGTYYSNSNTGYDTGKLTLKEVWFSYNGNSKKQNSYKFSYNGNNPRYNIKSYDRWGDYKSPTQNPSAPTNVLTNAEFPYSVQVEDLAAKNAAAWTLDNIFLPSGGKIVVSYESDDYAFVQNKRAAQMFKIAGFSDVNSSSLVTSLYTPFNSESGNRKVYVNVPTALTNATEVFNQYLQEIEKVYFKIYVKMPTDRYGGGYEYVPCYADLDKTTGTYGVVSGNNHQIWFTIKGINRSADGDGSYSPLAKAAIQFLRLNLPSKAYPYSDIGDNINLSDAIHMEFAMLTNVINSVTSFDVTAMKNGWACTVDTSHCYVRLNNPTYKKFGGGLRVKRIEIYDNWKAMTSTDAGKTNGQNESVYGKEYTYTTVREINGIPTTISSGVASYEPTIGGEENPWRTPLEYTEKVAPLAPTSMGYTELPLGEGFFPGASVGYSQVRVRSINTKNKKSANGYEETKFYTTYDFPTLTDYTPLADNKKRYKPALANFLRFNAKHYLAVSQGFKVELNDMNGKVRSQATYPETDSVHYISYTENFYRVDDQSAISKHLNNTVPVIDPQGTIDEQGIIGKDVELMADMRQQLSITSGGNFEANTDAFLAFILPTYIPTIWFLPQREENLFHSAAMTKIIQRYGILDSVVVIDKGSKVSTKNLLYDAETGDVLLTRTNNEFNDPIYNFTYPAHWTYSGMEPAYKNIQAVFTSQTSNTISFSGGAISSSGVYTSPLLSSYFESGDEVEATYKTGTQLDKDTSTLLWVVNKAKLVSNGSGIFFIDRDGTPFSATADKKVNLKIVRSGKRNMAAAPVAGVTCLNNPMKLVNNQMKVVIDAAANVINSSAVSFKDVWTVKDNFYKQDSITSHWIELNPTAVTQKAKYSLGGAPYQDWGMQNSNVVGYGYYHNTNCNNSDLVYEYKTIMDFNFTSIPAGADVTNATITLTPNLGNGYYNFDPNASYYACTGNMSGVNQFSYPTGYNTKGVIEQVSATWNFNTTYNQIQGIVGGSQVQITNSSVDYDKKNCTALIEDIIKPGANHGILFHYQQLNSSDNTEFLTFCASGSCAPLLHIDYNTTASYCLSSITQKQINPYISGLLGNWRSNRSYVYYGERAESDPLVQSNIRKDGVIKNFAPYWNQNVSNIWQPTTDTTKWVWNAEITKFNRKGFELENHDPLGRYNAGQYGYNESMPVSVTQNSKYREQMFDGFEDYSYDNTGCPSGDCPPHRFADFSDKGGYIFSTRAHTGKYSLHVPSDANITFSIPVVNKDTITPVFAVNSNIITTDSTALNPDFSLTPGSKYWFSGWVNEDTACPCTNFKTARAKIIFKNGDTEIDSVFTVPGGPIIEGWQRYDTVFQVPANATSIVLRLGAYFNDVYFDDLRIHPYNANMKAFVYDPVNLRLMAELDENNYATFYEYDDDGTLSRVKKETQKGIMTLQETRSYQVR